MLIMKIYYLNYRDIYSTMYVLNIMKYILVTIISSNYQLSLFYSKFVYDHINVIMQLNCIDYHCYWSCYLHINEPILIL